MNQPNLILCVALIAFGIVFHFVTKLSELESAGRIITPWQYWREHPYTSLSVIMAAYLFMLLQYGLGELTHSSALLTGYACNSIGDRLRARASKLS